MLQSIRDKTSGWIAYLIIGFISIPFALWGINSYLGGGEQQPAAIVDGEEISVRELDSSYARYRDRLRQVFGGTLPAAFDNEIALKEQVLGQIIEERVLLGYADKQGYRIGNQELAGNIQAMSAFHTDGKFDQELYQRQLASQGYSPAQFEQELRRTSSMGQLNQAIRASAFTLPTQLETYNNLKNQGRKLRLLTVENTPQDVDVSDQEVEDYYNQQSARYMTPARAKIDYIEVSLDRIMSSVEVDEDRLRERYEQMLDQLTTPEVRSASHILLTVGSDAGDDEIDRTREKILELKARVDAGEDFAALATDHSQDPGSAAEGGDLGEVEQGMMVKPFETALFDLQPGQVSEPVKTRFGWHLIKLHEVSGGVAQSFDEARSRIESDIKTELAETRIYDLVENLSNIGYEQPDSLLPASEQLDLKIETTDWFTRGEGDGVAGEEKFRAAAFSDDVLNKNRNSETIELSENRVVIMHLNQHEPAQMQPLDEVRAAVAEAVRHKKGREEAMQRGKALLDAVREGRSLDDVAADEGLSVFDAGYVLRTDSSVASDVLSAAFAMAKPSDGPVVEAVSEAGGDYTIIELSDIQVKSDDSESTEVGQRLTEAAAASAYQALIKALTAEASVVRTPVVELLQ